MSSQRGDRSERGEDKDGGKVKEERSSSSSSSSSHSREKRRRSRSPSRSRSRDRSSRKSHTKDKKDKRDKKSSRSDRDRDRDRKKSKKDKRRDKSKRSRRDYSDSSSSDTSSDSESSSSSSSSSDEDDDDDRRKSKSSKKQSRAAASATVSQLATLGYQNESNPFGDKDLSKPFVWQKKIQKMVESGEKVQAFTPAAVQAKLEANRMEIVKLQERRAKREEDQANMAKLKEELAKGLELEANLGWEDKEEEFHRQQAMIRTEIRLREGREKAIDLLVKNIQVMQKIDDPESLLNIGSHLGQTEHERKAREAFIAALEVDLDPPHTVFEGLPLPDLRELRVDIQRHIDLGVNVDKYWKPLMLLCEREILTAEEVRRSHSALKRSQASLIVAGRGTNLDSETIMTIMTLLEGRSLKELKALEADVDSVIANAAKTNRNAILQHAEDGDAPSSAAAEVDVNYWNAIKSELQIFKARATLTLFHRKLVAKRLAQLKKEAAAEQERLNQARRQQQQQQRGGSSSLSSSGHGNADDDDDEVDMLSVTAASADGQSQIPAVTVLPDDASGDVEIGEGGSSSTSARGSASSSSSSGMEEEKNVHKSPVLRPLSSLSQEEKHQVVTLEEDFRELDALRRVVLDQRVEMEVEKIMERRQQQQSQSAAAFETTTASTSRTPTTDASGLGITRFGDSVADSEVMTEATLLKQAGGTKLAADEEIMRDADLGLTATYKYVAIQRCVDCSVASVVGDMIVDGSDAVVCGYSRIAGFFYCLTPSPFLFDYFTPHFLQLARQVPPSKAQVLQQGQDRLRLESLQLDALRQGQPPSQGCAGIQVQYLLPRPYRPVKVAHVPDSQGPRWESRLLHHQVLCWSSL